MLGDLSPLWGIPIGALLYGWGSVSSVYNCARCHRDDMAILKCVDMAGPLFWAWLMGSFPEPAHLALSPYPGDGNDSGQQLKGISLIFSFALGHCLPIVIAGSSVAIAQRLLSAKGMQSATVLGRRLAGGLVIAIGLFFITIAIASLL